MAMSDSQKLTIAMLAGGESPERDVSLASGESVQRALEERGHSVIPIDPADVDISTYDWTGIDVAFLALHGPYGEDGQVQKILDDAGVFYTGSDAVASHMAFNKSAAKERFMQSYVPTPAYTLIHEAETAEAIANKARGLGFPLVVKPDAQGSSLGVSIVDSPDQLAEGLSRCFHLDAFGMLEGAVEGTEWTVGILDDLVLPLIQIKPAGQFFDYHAKYEDAATGYIFEFDIPSDVISNINQVARNAYTALGLKGMARIDIMLDKYQRPWVLEANTIPGFTNHSLVPKAAARIGISFGELCEQMIESCLQPTGQVEERKADHGAT